MISISDAPDIRGNHGADIAGFDVSDVRFLLAQVLLHPVRPTAHLAASVSLVPWAHRECAGGGNLRNALDTRNLPRLVRNRLHQDVPIASGS